AATRLRRGREPAREEAPRALQPRRIHTVGRPRVRRAATGFVLFSTLHLPRSPRACALPDALPEGTFIASRGAHHDPVVPPFRADPHPVAAFVMAHSPGPGLAVGFRLGSPRRGADHGATHAGHAGGKGQESLRDWFSAFHLPRRALVWALCRRGQAWHADLAFAPPLGLPEPGPRRSPAPGTPAQGDQALLGSWPRGQGADHAGPAARAEDEPHLFGVRAGVGQLRPLSQRKPGGGRAVLLGAGALRSGPLLRLQSLRLPSGAVAGGVGHLP